MPEFREGQRVRSTQIIEGTVVMAPKIMERGTYPTLKDDNGDLWPLYDLTRTYEILAEPMPPAPAEHSIMMDRLDCTWRMRTCGMAERLGVGDTALEMTWVGAWKDFGPFTVLREGRG
jgi:hypothetical protein